MAVLQRESYRSHRLEVVDDAEGVGLHIDGKPVLATVVAGGDRYLTPFCPYRTYNDLISLGKAVIRSGNWTSAQPRRSNDHS